MCCGGRLSRTGTSQGLLCCVCFSFFFISCLGSCPGTSACGGFGLCASLWEMAARINNAHFKRTCPPRRILSYCYSVRTKKRHGAASAWWFLALWSRHPCTADQGTARGVFVATRASGAERRKARPVGAVMQFCGRSCTLPSYMCFTAVYCTCTRGPVRNRNRTRVPALSLRTRWIRTRGSSAFLENPLDPNPRFHG